MPKLYSEKLKADAVALMDPEITRRADLAASR